MFNYSAFYKESNMSDSPTTQGIQTTDIDGLGISKLPSYLEAIRIVRHMINTSDSYDDLLRLLYSVNNIIRREEIEDLFLPPSYNRH